ncbi:MAG: HNH endonuclease, partial [Phycisphaerales bacterium]
MTRGAGYPGAGGRQGGRGGAPTHAAPIAANKRPGSSRRSRKIRQAVLDRDRWRCRWCGVRIHPRCDRGCNDCATVDHLAHWRDAPHLRDDEANLIAACRHCNLTRGVGTRPRPRPGAPLAALGAGGSGGDGKVQARSAGQRS